MSPDPALEQDEQDEEPVDKKDSTWVKITKLIITPLLIAAVSGWFEYRLKSAEQRREAADEEGKKRTDAAYQATAPAILDLNKQISLLAGKVDTLQQLLFTVQYQVDGAPSALTRYKKQLVDKLSVAPPVRSVIQLPPMELDDAVKRAK